MHVARGPSRTAPAAPTTGAPVHSPKQLGSARRAARRPTALARSKGGMGRGRILASGFATGRAAAPFVAAPFGGPTFAAAPFVAAPFGGPTLANDGGGEGGGGGPHGGATSRGAFSDARCILRVESG